MTVVHCDDISMVYTVGVTLTVCMSRPSVIVTVLTDCVSTPTHCVSCHVLKQEGGFLTALEFSDRRKMCFRITTGSQELELVYSFVTN